MLSQNIIELKHIRIPNKNSYWLYITVFLLLFGIRVFYIAQKDGMHLDESFMISLSTYSEYVGYDIVDNQYVNCKNYDTDKIYTGRDLKEITYWDNATWRDTFYDIWQLYLDHRDPSHSNFYFILSCLWHIGLKTGDLNTIFWYGCSLNLAFFTIAFLLLYALSAKLFKDDFWILLTLFFSFANTASISNALLMRDYQLQEMLFILMTYVFVNIYNAIDNHANISSPKNFIIIMLTMTITFLSGHFAIIYVGILALILSFRLLITRQQRYFPFYIGVVFSAFILMNLLSPTFYKNFLMGRGVEAMDKFSINGLVENFNVSLTALWQVLSAYLFYPLFLLACLLPMFVIKFKRQISATYADIFRRRLILTIFGAALFWCALVMYAAPYKFLRYIMPAFPLLSFSLIFFLDTGLKSAKKWAIVCLIVFCGSVIYALVPKAKPAWQTLADYHREANLTNQPLYVYKGKNASFVFNQHPEIPVFILTPPDTMHYSELIPYLADEQEYVFCDTPAEIAAAVGDKKEFYIVANQRINIANPENKLEIKFYETASMWGFGVIYVRVRNNEITLPAE